MNKQVLMFFLLSVPGWGVLALEPINTKASVETGSFRSVRVRPYIQPSETRGDLKDPDSAGLCELYQQNINYLARKGIPRHPEISVAPKLARRIQVLEWENLDPDQYPTLFRDAVAWLEHGNSKTPTESEISGWRHRVKSGWMVFRRSEDLIEGPVKGISMLRREAFDDRPSIPHYLVQIGDHPKSRKSNATALLFLVSAELGSIHSKVIPEYWSYIGDALIYIDGRVYLQLEHQYGDIELQELLTDFPDQPETVCYFQFNSLKRK